MVEYDTQLGEIHSNTISGLADQWHARRPTGYGRRYRKGAENLARRRAAYASTRGDQRYAGHIRPGSQQR